MTAERRRRRGRRKRVIRLITLLATITFFILFFVLYHKTKSAPQTVTITPTPTPIPTSPPTPTPVPSPIPTINNSASLGDAVQSALIGTKGKYGVAVKHLTTGETYYANEHRIYTSGSLYKLWTMATVFEQMQEGKFSENTIVTDTIAGLNKSFSIDPEYAEKTEGSISLSVKEALERMITVSDNYAALLLTKKVRLSNVSAWLKKYGFIESKVGGQDTLPKTTPADIALFMEKLYKGELANEASTQAMIGLLKRQRLNEKIPKYLPEDIAVAHKTGELYEVTHDAGIVYTPEGNYIIVVLSESISRQQSNERIANISEAVYHYFNQKP